MLEPAVFAADIALRMISICGICLSRLVYIKDLNVSKIIAATYATFAAAKRKIGLRDSNS